MKDWENTLKERLANRKAELPESDWNDFLSRRAAHELAVKRRRRIISAAFSIPAAAAVLLLLFMMPTGNGVPENQVSENKPQAVTAVVDSIEANTVDSIVKPVEPETEKPVIKKERPLIREKVPVKRSLAEQEPTEQPEEIEQSQILVNDNHLIAENKQSDDMIGLDMVAVSVMVSKVQMVNDTVMFNSAAFKLPESSSVEDLIRKLPGVKIDSTGSITVNGKSVNKIAVNDQVIYDNNNTVALTQLTADMIEKVKAYQKNSDLSRMTGIDDGNEESVMDLPVKRKLFPGNPTIILNGQIADVDEDMLSGFDFGRKVNKRKMSRLLGIPAREIKTVKVYDTWQARKIWGEKGANGVISVTLVSR